MSAHVSVEQRHAVIVFLKRGIYSDSHRTDTDDQVHVCPRCLERACDFLSDADGDKSKAGAAFWHDIRSERKFWIQAVALITMRRLDLAAHEKLEVKLRAAFDLCRNSALHPPATLRSEQWTSVTMQFLHLALIFCADSSSNSKKRQFRLNGEWPSCRADIMPRGPTQTVAGLTLMWALLETAPTAELLPKLVSFCDQDMIPVLIENHSDLFCRTVITKVYNAIKRSAATHDSDHLNHRLLWTFKLLSDVERCCGSRERVRKLFAGREDAMSTVMRKIMRVCSDDSSGIIGDVVKTAVKIAGTSITAALSNMSDEQYGRVKLELECNVLGNLARLEGGPFVRAHMLLQLVTKELRCCGPNCNTYGEEGARVTKCAKCKLCRYCSKECQVAHWKAKELPHKLTCGMYEDLGLADGLSMGKEDFSKMCAANGVTVSRLAMAMTFFALSGQSGYSAGAEAFEFKLKGMYLLATGLAGFSSC